MYTSLISCRTRIRKRATSGRLDIVSKAKKAKIGDQAKNSLRKQKKTKKDKTPKKPVVVVVEKTRSAKDVKNEKNEKRDLEEYVIESVMEHRVIKAGRERTRYAFPEYYVKYVGYDHTWNEWPTEPHINKYSLCLQYWKNKGTKVDFNALKLPDMKRIYRTILELSIPGTFHVNRDSFHLDLDSCRAVVNQLVQLEVLDEKKFAETCRSDSHAREVFRKERIDMMMANRMFNRSSHHIYQCNVSCPKKKALGIEHMFPLDGSVFEWRFELETHREFLLERFHKARDMFEAELAAMSLHDRILQEEEARDRRPPLYPKGADLTAVPAAKLVSSKTGRKERTPHMHLDRQSCGWVARMGPSPLFKPPPPQLLKILRSQRSANRTIERAAFEFPPGTVLCHLAGELTPVAEAREMYRTIGEFARRFFVQLPYECAQKTTHVVDRRRYRDPSFFFPHSCTPNCMLIWRRLGDNDSLLEDNPEFKWFAEIVTVETVKSNENFTLDWYMQNRDYIEHDEVVQYMDEKNDFVRCECSSNDCRAMLFHEREWIGENYDRIGKQGKKSTRWTGMRKEEKLAKLNLSQFFGARLHSDGM